MPTYSIEVNITEREVDIVQLLADGYTVKEISQTLSVNKRTLEAKILGMRRKFRSATLAGLVAIFLRNQLIN